MNKSRQLLPVKLVFTALFLLLSINYVSSFEYTCYQETANSSHPSDGNCGFNYNGVYYIEGTFNTPSNLYDGDWGTSSFSGDATLYINYSKPEDAPSSAIWQIKTASITNVTIDPSCFNYNPSLLQLRVHTTFNAGYTTADCYNGTSWISQSLPNSGFYSVYEEGLFWQINNSQLVESCQVINQSGIYVMNASIVPISGNTCINITVPNATFNCRGYSIANSTFSGSGILTNKDNTSIKRCTVETSNYAIYLMNTTNSTVDRCQAVNSSRGILVRYGRDNSVINNILAGNQNGIYLDASEGNTVRNNTHSSEAYSYYLTASAHRNILSDIKAFNCTTSCIYNFNSDYNQYTSLNLSNSKVGIILESVLSSGHSSHNTFKDGILELISGTSIQLKTVTGSSNLNNSFVNMTYNNESVMTNSQLHRKWYYQIQSLDNSSLLPLSGVNITISNSSNATMYSAITNVQGYSSIYEMIDYINIAGTKYYYSPYNIVALFRGEYYYKTFNSTLNQNNLTDVVYIINNLINYSVGVDLLISLFDSQSYTIPSEPSSPSTGGTGAGNHQDKICDYAYSFLIDKKGANYTIEEVNTLTNIINANIYPDSLLPSTIESYLNDFTSRCQRTLPNFNNQSGVTLIDYSASPSPCAPDLNSTLTFLNAKYDMDTSLPFFRFEIGQPSCTAVEITRWFFKLEKSATAFKIIGLKLWWIIMIIVTIASVTIYKNAKRANKKKKV